MGKHIHTLKNIDTILRHGKCETCGNVSIIKVRAGGYACANRYYLGRLNSTSIAKQVEAKRYFLFKGIKKSKDCDICGAKTRLNRDHCHKTMKARGWLCTNCNLGIGYFKDDINLLKRAIAYLR